MGAVWPLNINNNNKGYETTLGYQVQAFAMHPMTMSPWLVRKENVLVTSPKVTILSSFSFNIY